jgi:DNA-binding NarL/FixJ family response regulator
MGLLTDLERRILSLAQRGKTDYRIAKEVGSDVNVVTRSRKNALRKLREANEDVSWARSLGLQDFNVVPRRIVIKEETESPMLRPAF